MAADPCREVNRTIILIRHGETEWNKEKIFRGHKDVPLNGRGQGQARDTARALTGFKIDEVYSSPLSRAMMTAREIAAGHDLPVFPRESFIDIDFGVWEGLSLKEIQQKYPREYRSWVETPHLWKASGGETLLEVRERSWKELLQLIREVSGETLVVVTHRVVLKMLLMAVLGMGDNQFWMLQQGPCALNVIKYWGGRGFTVECLNDICHLYPLSQRVSAIDF
ncbi:MAG TPA: histidine phosphatase family protein [Firmicutes bacterium]|nr:histidine phosphatase family protein [Bacillota bacterium]